MDNDKILSILKEDMRPALGVTDPMAIALASSAAYRAVGGHFKYINVITDPGIFKNGFSCTIPGTKEKGNEIAALLGVLAGNPDLNLEVLKNIKDEDIATARKLREEKAAEVKVKRGLTKVYIDATVTTDKGIGRAVIEDIHANIVLIEANGAIKYKKKMLKDKEKENNKYYLNNFTIVDFKSFVDDVSFEEIKFALEAIKMNTQLAEEGRNRAGMGVGTCIAGLIKENKISNDLRSYSELLTAYAVDARMGGFPKPAMSIAGSGDHGIVSTMPLLAVAEKMDTGEEQLARAIILSYLITIYIKNFSGILSAFCGCAVAAGTGASTGIVYLMRGNSEQIGYAINNMAANITGMICDGGNFGCALKAVTGAGTAVISALFAMKNVVIPEGSGIVGVTTEETMHNMGKIASPGMLKTDETILSIMEERRK